MVLLYEFPVEINMNLFLSVTQECTVYIVDHINITIHLHYFTQQNNWYINYYLYYLSKLIAVLHNIYNYVN